MVIIWGSTGSSRSFPRRFVLAYDLGNFLRRLGLPKAIKNWSLRSVWVKLIRMGARLVRHARRLVFLLAEVAVPPTLFQGVLDRPDGIGVEEVRFLRGPAESTSALG